MTRQRLAWPSSRGALTMPTRTPGNGRLAWSLVPGLIAAEPGIRLRMFKRLMAGAAAGAAGTTALNAATYADMAWRGRPSSTTQQQAVEELAKRAGQPIPGEGEERQNRLEGLGALAGIVTGITVGALAGPLRGVLLRLGPVLGPVTLGGSAMLATDATLARLGLTDPRTWDAASWLSDAGPHLAFGIAAYATLSATACRLDR